jgi:hypothetical protein
MSALHIAAEAGWAKYSQRIAYEFNPSTCSYGQQITEPVMTLIGYRLAVMDIIGQTGATPRATGRPPVTYPVSLADLINVADAAAELDGMRMFYVDQPAEQARIASVVAQLHDLVERAAAHDAAMITAKAAPTASAL